MRNGAIIRAAALAALLAGFAGAATAQQAEAPDSASNSAQTQPAQAQVLQTPAETAAATWYQDYVQGALRNDLGAPTVAGPSVELNVSDRWGVSLGFENNSRLSREQMDGVSAGAFFRVSPRVRVGGELGFRAQQGDAAGLQPIETGSSQVKLESAFRF